MTWIAINPPIFASALPRPYLEKFRRKLSPKDKRRIQKNKAIKKFQTVRKTIKKKLEKSKRDSFCNPAI